MALSLENGNTVWNVAQQTTLLAGREIIRLKVLAPWGLEVLSESHSLLFSYSYDSCESPYRLAVLLKIHRLFKRKCPRQRNSSSPYFFARSREIVSEFRVIISIYFVCANPETRVKNNSVPDFKVPSVWPGRSFTSMKNKTKQNKSRHKY